MTQTVTNNEIKEGASKMKNSLMISGVFVVMLWAIKIVEVFSESHFSALGIIPRKWYGLFGILTAPFIHGDDFLFFQNGQLAHLASNTLPIFILMASLFYFYQKIAWKSLLGMWVMTGVWVWLGARGGSAHIGASGLIYAFAAFLFFSGLFRRDVRSLTISLIVGFLYGGMVWGVLPTQEYVSWESHLFGAVSGVVMAWFFRNVEVAKKKKYFWEDEPDEDPRDERAIWNYKNHFPEMPEEEMKRIREGIGRGED